MFYAMDTDYIEATIYLVAENNDYVSMYSGNLLDEQELELPFLFTAEVDIDDEGEPKPFNGDAFFPDCCLMRNDLIAALQQAGVDNLQCFPAEIQLEEAEPCHDYQFVNVIGLVSCVDEANSEGVEVADFTVFENLTLDASKIGDLKLFRLKEEPSKLIISQSVQKALAELALPGLEFEAVGS